MSDVRLHEHAFMRAGYHMDFNMLGDLAPLRFGQIHLKQRARSCPKEGDASAMGLRVVLAQCIVMSLKKAPAVIGE